MKKIIVIALAVVLVLSLSLTSVTLAYYCGWDSEVLEPMTYYIGCGEGAHCPNGDYCGHGACGPASAVAIGAYYRDRDEGYSELPSPNSHMYDVLYDYMDTWVCATGPLSYGPGFVEMALHYGYDNFRYVYDDDVTQSDEDNDTFPDDFKDIKDAIDNGWPVVLKGCFEDVSAISNEDAEYPSYWPPGGGLFCGHYIVIRGYEYYLCYYQGTPYTYYHRIICTDNWCGGNNLVLDWSTLVTDGSNLETIIIKDDDPENDGYVEDFEWGRTSLEFNGSSDYVDIPFSYTSFSAFTIEFWMKTSDTTNLGTPISMSDGTQHNEILLYNYKNFDLYLEGSHTGATEVSANDGKWHHIAWTWQRSDGETKLFKDGREVYSGTLKAGGAPNPANLIVGQEQDAYGGGFDAAQAFLGKISEIRIWDDVRTETEIQDNMYSELTGSESNLVGYWKIDEGVIQSDDFEWGSDGDPLDNSEGEITWTVVLGGSAYVDIDTYTKVSGTRSAIFHSQDGSNTAAAYFTQEAITAGQAINWWYRKDDATYCAIWHGNGSKYIRITISSSEIIYYYDDTGHHSTGESVTLNTWEHFCIDDVDWSSGTYDIWLEGEKIQDDATMKTSSSFDDEIRFINTGANANMWIDDVAINPGIIEDSSSSNDDGTIFGADWVYQTSLEEWQDLGGEVEWDTSTYGNSAVVEIDPYQAHTGTRSARFCRSSYHNPYAYYDLFQPSYIGFYMKKDNTASAEFRIGNGSKYIRVRINSEEEIQYYGPYGWYTLSYTFPVNTWIKIEFWISWAAGTYGIYTSGTIKGGGTMRSGGNSNGHLYFGSWDGSGEFWIDDIKDSLRPLY